MVHTFEARGVVQVRYCSDLGQVLSDYEEGNRFYVFAGTFPSSERLHLRHLVPLRFAQHVQKVYGAPVVVYVPDENPRFVAHCKTILGCGLDKSQTFFLRKGSLPSRMYEEIVKFSRMCSLEEIDGGGCKDMKTLRDVAVEAVLCRTPLFGPEFKRCLRLGQDSFRGVVPKGFGWREPAVVEFKPLPTLQGELGKTSSHDDNWIVFLSDPHSVVKSKINKHAFSGGGATIQEHRENGANLEVDVPYKYLLYFLDNNAEFDRITKEYGEGTMFTGAVKGRVIQLLDEIVAGIQSSSAEVRDDEVLKLTLPPCYGSRPGKDLVGSDLPDVLLERIMSDSSIRDICSFGSVCRQWQCIGVQSSDDWVLLTHESSCLRVIDLRLGRVFSLQICAGHPVGAGGGLLLIHGEASNSYVLLNPVTKATRELPTHGQRIDKVRFAGIHYNTDNGSYKLGIQTELGFFVLDWNSETWTRVTQPPEQVFLPEEFSHRCIVSGDMLYVAAGSRRREFDMIARFNFKTLKWAASIAIPCGFDLSGFVHFGGKLLVTSYNSSEMPALFFDESTATFEPAPEVQFPTEFWASQPCVKTLRIGEECRIWLKPGTCFPLRTSQEATTQVVTPFNVSAGVDYDKLVSEFGCTAISKELIDRLEKLTGKPAHPLLKRGIFFAHRDLQAILDAYEKGQRFYLYTGRGPSSEALHLGHLLQFTFTRYLQDAFDVPVVIQLSTDEKYLWKDISVEKVEWLARENARDILACGFQLERTFVFSNLDYVAGHFDARVSDIASLLSPNDMCAVFGLNPKKDSLGKFLYPPVQIAPAFSTSFPELFGDGVKMRCLIPCAIDQDPYFRVSRDVAYRLKLPKPALIESRFLPSIQGSEDSGKMSASSPDTAIFVTDTRGVIELKVAGCDVPETLLTYLSFFMRSDSALANINEAFSCGKSTIQEVRGELVSALWDSVELHQREKKKITNEVLEQFMTTRKLF